MSDLSTDINNLKKKYREIFLKTSEELHLQIEKIRPQKSCVNCTVECTIGCTKNDNSKAEQELELFQKFPQNCDYKKWQDDVIKLFDGEISKGIYEKWMKILEYRKNFQCTGCATCCKLACSEFSYEELKQKAAKGDNFATQFTSIFIPYESESQAREIYPEYFELLAEKLDGEPVYFYHCPKLTADNRCSDYENRPGICRDFPDNPLSMLPASCGYSKWKEEVEPVALMLHSMLEIIDFYKGKISEVNK